MNNDEKGPTPSAEHEDKSREDFLENGKSVINNLLWRFAPPSARLGELDDAALVIFERILKLWEADHE